MLNLKKFTHNLVHSKPVAFAFLIFMTLAVYSLSLGNGFVWDDYMVLVDNSFVHSLDNLHKLLTREYLTSPSDLPQIATGLVGSGEGSYRPVATFMHFMEFQAWGLDPFFYHLVSVLLHCLNVCLVFVCLNMLFGQFALSFIASILFAIHPAQSEAVFSISFREDVLAGLFYLGAFIAFMKHQTQRNSWCVLGWVCFFLALFSKEMALTLPILLMFYDYVVRKSTFDIRSFLVKYGGYILISIFYVWIRFFVMSPLEEFDAQYPGESFVANVLVMFKVIGTYVVWMITGIGVHLTKEDPAFIKTSIFHPYIIALVCWLAVWVHYILTTRKGERDIALFSLGWFLITLLPVLNIIPIYNIIASRYLYLPCIGFYVFVACLLNRHVKHIDARVCAVAIYTLFLIVMTFARGFVWQNEITLRNEFYQYYPNDPLTYRTFSAAYLRYDRYERAEEWLKKGQLKFPEDTMLKMDLARLYRQQKKYDLALVCLDDILKDGYVYFHAVNERCIVLSLQENREEADQCYRNALKVFPENDQLKMNHAIFMQTLREEM